MWCPFANALAHPVLDCSVYLSNLISCRKSHMTSNCTGLCTASNTANHARQRIECTLFKCGYAQRTQRTQSEALTRRSTSLGVSIEEVRHLLH